MLTTQTNGDVTKRCSIAVFWGFCVRIQAAAGGGDHGGISVIGSARPLQGRALGSKSRYSIFGRVSNFGICTTPGKKFFEESYSR